MIRNTTVVDSEAAETKMDTGEHNADVAEIKDSNPNIESQERQERPVTIHLVILLTLGIR